MIDGETFLVTLLERDVVEGGSPHLEQERDIDTLDSLPALIYSVTGTGQQANADGLWSVTLELTSIAESASEAFSNIASAYDAIHGWAALNLGIVGDTWVATVEDIQLPSKDDTTDLEGKTLAHYSGSWGLGLRTK